MNKKCKCGRTRPEFVFDVYYGKLRCDYCRTNAAQKRYKNSIDPWAQVRWERDRLLTECDWVMLVDARKRMTVEQRREWVKYRQDLCDITKQENVDELVWPVKP